MSQPLKFTFQAHPPALKPTPVLSLRAKPPTSTEDPHKLPVFSDESLAQPSKPVLYLPPLLSSLPESLPALTITPETPWGLPLTTETRLPDIDPASLSLHKALHSFRPVDDDYSAQAYAEAFNWADLQLPLEEEREWYSVAFRSKRKDGGDGTPLYAADRLAHEEAVRNGGLIMYWYGIPNAVNGMNMATCIWQSRKHAVAANSRPLHIEAMKLAKDSYEVYNLERHIIRKSRGETGVTVEPFTGGDVGW